MSELNDSKYKRYRLNVPVQDESTIAWVEAQVNLSTSLRQLIRAEIERNGYVDAMCTPVAQLPKQGRPAGSTKRTVSDEPVAETVTETAAKPVQPDLLSEQPATPPRAIQQTEPVVRSMQQTVPQPSRFFDAFGTMPVGAGNDESVTIRHAEPDNTKAKPSDTAASVLALM